MRTYTVTAERGAGTGVWVFQSVEHPGAMSQGRRLTDAKRLMPEAIGFVAGVDPWQVRIRLRVALPGDLGSEVEDARAAVDDLAARQKSVAERSRQTAKALAATGLSGAEVAAVLEVSPQRVSQLMNA